MRAMNPITLYGIPNCDTVKKARTWLAEHRIDAQFHDFKKQGVPPEAMARWITQVGWEPLLNRRGMMWRKLDDKTKANIDHNSARTIMLETPSIIKRPVLDHAGELTLGFTEERYRALLQD